MLYVRVVVTGAKSLDEVIVLNPGHSLEVTGIHDVDLSANNETVFITLLNKEELFRPILQEMIAMQQAGKHMGRAIDLVKRHMQATKEPEREAI